MRRKIAVDKGATDGKRKAQEAFISCISRKVYVRKYREAQHEVKSREGRTQAMQHNVAEQISRIPRLSTQPCQKAWQTTLLYCF
jgi:hypothetical protein